MMIAVAPCSECFATEFATEGLEAEVDTKVILHIAQLADGLSAHGALEDLIIASGLLTYDRYFLEVLGEF